MAAAEDESSRGELIMKPLLGGDVGSLRWTGSVKGVFDFGVDEGFFGVLGFFICSVPSTSGSGLRGSGSVSVPESSPLDE